MKIGVYGGTFDPPHLGHMEAARAAAEALGLDKLLLIPAAVPPHKALPPDAVAPQHCHLNPGTAKHVHYRKTFNLFQPFRQKCINLCHDSLPFLPY